MIPALLQIGHLLGVALLIGGLFFAIYAVLPAQESLPGDSDEFRSRLRDRARGMTLTAVVLIFATGLLKWSPVAWGLGGTGLLGGEGKYTAVLHGKLVLAVLALYFASVASLASTPDAKRVRLSKAALHMGFLIIALAVIHNLRALD